MGGSHKKKTNVYSEMVRFFKGTKVNKGFGVSYSLFHIDLGYPKKIKVIDLCV